MSDLSAGGSSRFHYEYRDPAGLGAVRLLPVNPAPGGLHPGFGDAAPRQPCLYRVGAQLRDTHVHRVRAVAVAPADDVDLRVRVGLDKFEYCPEGFVLALRHRPFFVTEVNLAQEPRLRGRDNCRVRGKR